MSATSETDNSSADIFVPRRESSSVCADKDLFGNVTTSRNFIRLCASVEHRMHQLPCHLLYNLREAAPVI